MARHEFPETFTKNIPHSERKGHWNISVGFFILGFLSFLLHMTIFSAAQDILAGTQLPTSLVNLVDAVLNNVVLILGPYFVTMLPYSFRTLVVCLLTIAAYFTMSFAEDVRLRLFGIGLQSVSWSVSQITFLSLTTFFPSEKALSAYSTGTGFGVASSGLYYTAMTTWLCVSPTITLVAMAPTSLLVVVCYYIIMKASNQSSGYTKLEDSEDREKEHKSSKQRQPTAKDKMSAILKLLKYTAVPMFQTWCCKFLFIQSVVPTIAYANAPFRPRDHYQYYLLIFWCGDLTGRSMRGILSIISSHLLYNITLTELWLLAFITVSHTIFLVFESWYRFLPGVEIVLVLCFTIGVSSGMLYTNAIEFFHKSLNEKEQEFGSGYSATFLETGQLAGALLGLYVEPRLKEHCTFHMPDSAYCLTRSSVFKNITLKCRVKST